MKKKGYTKTGAVMLSLGLIAGLLSGCSGGQSQNEKSAGMQNSSEAGETEHIKILAREFGVQTDIDSVALAINDYIEDKIGVTVEFTLLDAASYSQQVSLALSSGEEYDIIWFNTDEFNKYANTGALQPLDESVEKYGQDFLKCFSEKELEANKVDGQLLCMKNVCDKGSQYAFYMDKEIADKYGIKAENIHTIEDCTEALKIVHENEPQLYTIVPYVPGNGVMNGYVSSFYDRLTTVGVGYMFDDEELTPAYVYETDEYKEAVTLAHEWYKAGYIPKDVGTITERATELVGADKAFSFIGTYNPATLAQNSSAAGKEMICAVIAGDGYKTSSFLRGGFGVPFSSKKVDAAVKFLNLTYSDSYVINLLDYGIEGTHYIKNEDGLFSYPQGSDSSSTGYHMSIQSVWGNEFIAGVWEDNDPQIWEKLSEFNDSLLEARSLGLVIDTSNVKTQVSALANVVTQYAVPLENGELDTETGLNEFNEKLHAIGIEDVYNEVAAQMEAFKNE